MFGEMKVFSGSSHPELARGIATHMGMPLGRLKVTRFSNENIKVKIDENVREADVFVIQTPGGGGYGRRPDPDRGPGHGGSET